MPVTRYAQSIHAAGESNLFNDEYVISFIGGASEVSVSARSGQPGSHARPRGLVDGVQWRYGVQWSPKVLYTVLTLTD
jgi:hypothetical protein